MAVEQKTVGNPAKLPAQSYTTPCGMTIDKSLRSIRAHAATCKSPKCSGGSER
jgi:hypothetical protein